MKEGDIIEWRGVNKIHRGKVVKKDCVYICQMENGCTFSLNDLRKSKSARLIEV